MPSCFIIDKAVGFIYVRPSWNGPPRWAFRKMWSWRMAIPILLLAKYLGLNPAVCQLRNHSRPVRQHRNCSMPINSIIKQWWIQGCLSEKPCYISVQNLVRDPPSDTLYICPKPVLGSITIRQIYIEQTSELLTKKGLIHPRNGSNLKTQLI